MFKKVFSVLALLFLLVACDDLNRSGSHIVLVRSMTPFESNLWTNLVVCLGASNIPEPDIYIYDEFRKCVPVPNDSDRDPGVCIIFPDNFGVGGLILPFFFEDGDFIHAAKHLIRFIEFGDVDDLHESEYFEPGFCNLQ
jgi:hypothetical protein